MKKLIYVLALGLLTTPVLGKEYVITSSDKLSDSLGAGYNSEEEAFVGKCVTGDVVYVGKQESNLDFSQTISQRQLSKELGISAGGRARMGAITHSASANFLKNSKSNSFSISSIYSGNYSFRQRKLNNPRLNDIGVKLSNNPMRFQNTCGDNFSHKQSIGAKIFFSIRLDFTSKLAKQTFEANYSMSGPMASASASLRQAKNSFSKDTKVTITALQVGGDISKISDIFYSADGNGSKDFVSCSFGDLAKCENVLSNAIKYATDTEVGFPSQIKPDTDMNSAIGPAVLKTYAYSYEMMGEYINFSPALTRAIKATRKNLNNLFEDIFAQHNLVETLINSGTIRLSPRQYGKFTQMQSNIFTQMYSLAEGIEDCYQKPLECSEIWLEFEPTNDEGVKLYAEEEFEVEKETFAQWCDFGYTPFATEGTLNSVNALVSRAKEIDPDLFAPPGAGMDVDLCYIAGSILEKQRSLSVTESNLSDLRLIATLKNLTELDLGDNEIEDISPLSSLVNLTKLNLRENRIYNLQALTSLLNLTSLELSDNEIEDASPLSRLGNITYLDLRNNGVDIACPFPEEGICLIADYRYNNEFVPLTRNHTNLPSRLGHRVSKLSNGDLIVSGDLSMTNNSGAIGALSNYQTEFFHSGSIAVKRSFHTSTTLDSDEVLLTGGWHANTSAELYNGRTKSSKAIGNMNFPRVEHVATKLDNGDVLITGGWKGRNQFWTGRDSQATAELFDATTRKFVNIGSMRVPRAGHTMTKLNDGRVLIVGGFKVDHESNGQGIASAEIFDPKFNRFTKLTSRLRFGRGHHTATKLKDGRVLIVGGFSKENKATNRIEIFNPKNNSFHLVEETMNEQRAYHQAVLLPDGKVFIVGGEVEHFARRNPQDECKTCSKTAEIYDPYAGISTQTSAQMNVPRSQFSATLTNDNRIIIIGGKGNDARFSASMFEFSEF
ncbi:putative internalin A-like exported protein [Halobacteriovorax marinus SJ]|uniref:Internalin A-like exported protein n=1 Tax=Halobacteriovorax marinus (strain ATCC BAA-682 / DSM 15412 / SJ) TaxID=862908 RepID=E1X1H7_HALMS|nr:kelch repeat-containing protein [Halobacteriovorax marinus]CBW26568.1 putative internalin A-like exported protein [Halobacteriovorax marinus SJ]